MNGDLQELMKYIGDNHNAQMTAISNLGREFSEFKGNIEVRVKAVEDDQAKTEKRQWIHSCIVLAGSILHHDLGKWLNLKF